jgi:PncC family amidohydrolase
MLVSALAEVAGSRDFLKGSVVPGTNGALADHGVSAGALERHGAVSPEAAVAMATAARDRFGAHVGVAVTGLATEPGAHGEPIDTCYLGYALADGETHWTSGHYPARRLRGRSRASTQALLGLAHLLRLGHLPDRRDGR